MGRNGGMRRVAIGMGRRERWGERKKGRDICEKMRKREKREIGQ